MESATGRLLTIGLVAAAVAGAAWIADRRRVRRSDLDAVGWVPWTGLFFASLIVACVTLGLAGRAWLAG